MNDWQNKQNGRQNERWSVVSNIDESIIKLFDTIAIHTLSRVYCFSSPYSFVSHSDLSVSHAVHVRFTFGFMGCLSGPLTLSFSPCGTRASSLRDDPRSRWCLRFGKVKTKYHEIPFIIFATQCNDSNTVSDHSVDLLMLLLQLIWFYSIWHSRWHCYRIAGASCCCDSLIRLKSSTRLIYRNNKRKMYRVETPAYCVRCQPFRPLRIVLVSDGIWELNWKRAKMQWPNWRRERNIA